MNRINISEYGYEYTIEDGNFRLHGRPEYVYYRYRDLCDYVKSYLPAFICMERCIKDKEHEEELLNIEINFKCKFGTKRIKLGYLYRLGALIKSSGLNNEFFDWVIYFDVKYENALNQYELTRLFKTQDFLRELIEKRFALKKMIENKPLEQITVYTVYYNNAVLYADKSGIVTGTRTVDSYYVLRFEQAARGWEIIEKMIRKIPNVVIGHPVSIDKLKSTNFLIDWCNKNIENEEYGKYRKFISETLIECDLGVIEEFIEKFIDGL
jgi:hypothetical protein